MRFDHLTNLTGTHLVDGQLVLNRGENIGKIAAEIAHARGGRVIVVCPNFACIAAPEGEIMLWAR